MQIDLLDRRIGKELLKSLFIVQRSWRCIEFPTNQKSTLFHTSYLWLRQWLHGQSSISLWSGSPTSSISVSPLLFPVPCLPFLFIVSSKPITDHEQRLELIDQFVMKQLTQVIDVIHASCTRACPPMTFDFILRRGGRKT